MEARIGIEMRARLGTAARQMDAAEAGPVIIGADPSACELKMLAWRDVAFSQYGRHCRR